MIQHSKYGKLNVIKYESDNEFIFYKNKKNEFYARESSFSNLSFGFQFYIQNYLFLDNNKSKNSDELVVYPIENSEKLPVNSDWWQTDWFGYYHWNIDNGIGFIIFLGLDIL